MCLPASVRDVTSRLGLPMLCNVILILFFFCIQVAFCKFVLFSSSVLHCIPVPVLVRQGPPENQL